MTTRLRVVVVGSGVAGLTAALEAHRRGCDVTVVTKSAVGDTATARAQGGIAVALGADDAPADHAADTLAAGAGLCVPDAVEALVTDGPAAVLGLAARGVVFDRGDDGEWVRGLEAAHRRARILHAGGDATGAEIQRALGEAVAASAITVRAHAFVTDLVVDRGVVVGVDLIAGGRGERLDADAVVLATGGAGALWAHTTNPAVATGDGIAFAVRAGAAVADLEFVQFHPTVLAAGHAFLISEAVRGEGAVLRDADGCRFLADLHPAAELAPRDVVARAIAERMRAQAGAPVVLDATVVGPADPIARAAFLARRFPTIDRAVRERGLDWARAPIPVTPAAHYLMGGVVTDLDGRTTLPGLYAVGEVARTGVHGANRLASNSLLEGAVFGIRVAAAICGPARPGPRADGAASVARPPASTDAPAFARPALRQLMWDHVGLERDADGLTRAASVLARWADDTAASTPTSASEWEDRNLLTVAVAVTAAALARPASVGAHFRRDAVSPASVPVCAPAPTLTPALQEVLAC